MNSVNKYLARNLKIVNTKIKKLERCNLSLLDDEGNKYSEFDWVITASRLVKLLNFYQIHSVLYLLKNRDAPEFSLMLGFKKELNIDFDAAKITKDVS